MPLPASFLKRFLNDRNEENEKAKKQPVVRKTGNIMKGRSDLKKKGDKYTVDTEINIKKGIDAKTKRALKKSIIVELDKKMVGGSLQKLELEFSDSDSDNEPIPKQPLIKYPIQHNALQNYLSQGDIIPELITGKKANIIDAVNLEMLDDLSDADVVKKYNMLSLYFDDIGDNDYPVEMELEFIKPYKDVSSTIKKKYNKKNYNKLVADKAREALRELKDDIYGYFNMKEGTGLKKRRGRPKKKVIKAIIEESLLDFPKSSNTALNQYLEAQKKKQKDLVEKQQAEITNKLYKYLK